MKNSLKVLFCFVTLCSCKMKDFDRIEYYQNVLVIDSAFRYENDTIATIKNYKKLFSKYGVQNHRKYKEFERYAVLCDKKNKNFGGKRNLYKLIDLITPNKFWYKDFSFFKKHSMDSLSVLKRMEKRELKYNKIINDSCEIALYRDQHFRENGYDTLTMINDKKNINFFKWCVKNYGYPSREKIGPLKNQYGDFDSIFFIHAFVYDYYPELKEKLMFYIRTGECDPYYYADMVDRFHVVKVNSNTHGPYGYRRGMVLDEVIDSVSINKNRRTIGLPSLKHSTLYRKDTTQILKINDFNTIKKKRNNHK